MIKDRDYSIDFFKGITVICIVFIHTVWWSGQTYVPNIVAQLSLLLDVPLFFFLSGSSATFAFDKPKPFSGVVRLLGLFAFFFGIYAFFFEKHSIFKFYISSLFMQFPVAQKALIVSSSTWFIPVFVTVYLLAYLIILHVGNKTLLPLICILLFCFVYKYESIEAFKSLSLFNVSPDYIFANLFFFLLGYYYYKELRLLKNIRWYFSGLLVIVLYMTISHFKNIPFDLQSLKFPHRFFYLVASLISISLTVLLSGFIKKEFFINYLGKNALQFYLAQGLSSAIIFLILPYIKFQWPVKLMIAFASNLAITSILAFAIIFIFKYYIAGLTTVFAYIDNFKISNLKKSK